MSRWFLGLFQALGIWITLFHFKNLPSQNGLLTDQAEVLLFLSLIWWVVAFLATLAYLYSRDNIK